MRGVSGLRSIVIRTLDGASAADGSRLAWPSVPSRPLPRTIL